MTAGGDVTSAPDEHGGSVSRSVRGFSPAALRAARVRAGMTIASLADEAEVSETTIGQWERGIVQPTPRRLQRVADVLGTTVEDLVRTRPTTATLADLRQKQGLTAAELSERTGLSLSAISRAENGHGPRLPEHVAAALTKVYGMSSDELEDAWRRSRRATRQQ